MGYRSYIRRQKPLLTASMKLARVERCRKMLNNLKGHGKRIIFFSDEKNFTVDPVHNRQNDRYLGPIGDVDNIDTNIKTITKTKFPKKAMFFGVVASTGEVMSPVWIDGNLNADSYVKLLKKNVLPFINSIKSKHGDMGYAFQQDGAPSHRAKSTQAAMIDLFGKDNFWPKDMWPPNSPA